MCGAVAVAVVDVPAGCVAITPLMAPKPSRAAMVIPFLSRLRRRSASALDGGGRRAPALGASRGGGCGVLAMLGVQMK